MADENTPETPAAVEEVAEEVAETITEELEEQIEQIAEAVEEVAEEVAEISTSENGEKEKWTTLEAEVQSLKNSLAEMESLKTAVGELTGQTQAALATMGELTSRLNVVADDLEKSKHQETLPQILDNPAETVTDLLNPMPPVEVVKSEAEAVPERRPGRYRLV